MTRKELLAKAKPILFNTEMVKAILEGRKTVTRRAAFLADDFRKFHTSLYPDGWWFRGRVFRNRTSAERYLLHTEKMCRYAKGDILYVRETWTREGKSYFYRADFESDYLDPCETLSGGYPAECRYYPGCEGCTREKKRIRWRPSIHMPKEAARIFLRVTDVRVERFQDITEKQAVSEGFEPVLCSNCDGYGCPDCAGSGCSEPALVGFYDVWNSTIKPADRALYGWEANPWVWVISFERMYSDERA